MAKPASQIDWTEGNGDQATISVEPSAGKKLVGWGISERPPREYMNWLFQNIDEWLKYFETTTDGILSGGTEYDAIVGAGGTHPNIVALVGSAEWIAGTIKHVLIASSETLSAPVTLDKNDVHILFKSGVTIYSGANATGLTIDADRVRLSNGRFADFDGAGDKAVVVSATANWAQVNNCYFFNNDTAIDDLAANSSLNGNVEES